VKTSCQEGLGVIPLLVAGWTVDRRRRPASRSKVWTWVRWWPVCSARRQNVQIRCRLSPPKKGISSNHHPALAWASWGNRRFANATYWSR
jgi:hypothetical protein